MKVTLDHNCIIDLLQLTATGKQIAEVVADPSYACFVVNIGASEAQKRGATPERYDKFEELLASANISHLERIHPLAIWDVTYWNHCLWAGDETAKQLNEIQTVLFGGPLNLPAKDALPTEREKWLNRLCDAQALWSHIHYGHDIFLTNDGNFFKATKHPRLIALGAKQISRPNELRPNKALQPTSPNLLTQVWRRG